VEERTRRRDRPSAPAASPAARSMSPPARLRSTLFQSSPIPAHRKQVIAFLVDQDALVVLREQQKLCRFRPSLAAGLRCSVECVRPLSISAVSDVEGERRHGCALPSSLGSLVVLSSERPLKLRRRVSRM
jgi:hypothetical protein